MSERVSVRVCNFNAFSSDAFDLNFGVVIFRLRAGFDATEIKDDTGGTYVCTSHHILTHTFALRSYCSRALPIRTPMGQKECPY